MPTATTDLYEQYKHLTTAELFGKAAEAPGSNVARIAELVIQERRNAEDTKTAKEVATAQVEAANAARDTARYTKWSVLAIALGIVVQAIVSIITDLWN